MNLSETAYLAPTLDPAARVLMDAAELLEREGWVGGKSLLENRSGRNCASTAISAAARVYQDDTFLTHDRFSRFIGGGGEMTAIWAWNDHPSRTAAEVITTLRRAAGV